jgi:hypothetical protein
MSIPQMTALEEAIRAYEESMNRSNADAIEKGLTEAYAPQEEAKKAVYIAIVQMCEYLNAWKGNEKDPDFLRMVRKKVKDIQRRTQSSEIAYLIYYLIGFLERASGNHRAAYDAFEQSGKNPAFYRATVQKAAQKIYLDEQNIARELLTEALKRVPHNNPARAFVYWAIGRIDFGSGVKFPAAIEWFDLAIEQKLSTWYIVAYKAAALALIGGPQNMQVAKQLLEDLERDFQIKNIADVEKRESLNPTANSVFVRRSREILRQGLEKAGLQ